LQRELSQVLQSPFVKERYATLGIEPVGNSPDEFAAQVRADLARWQEVVKRRTSRSSSQKIAIVVLPRRSIEPRNMPSLLNGIATLPAPVHRDQPAVAAEPAHVAQRAPRRRRERHAA
jgi:hypothetical protein